jgi:hypothetical protein
MQRHFHTLRAMSYSDDDDDDDDDDVSWTNHPSTRNKWNDVKVKYLKQKNEN